MTVPTSVNYTTGLPSRHGLVAYGRGMLAEAADLRQTVAGQALTDGTCFASLVGLYAGEVVSKILFSVTQAGTSTAPTHFYGYLASTAGVKLAATADSASSGQLTAAGIGSLSFSSAFTVVTTGVYFAGLLQVGAFAGNALQVSRIGNATGAGQAFGSNPAYAVAQTGQTDIPASFTFSASDTSVWVALA